MFGVDFVAWVSAEASKGVVGGGGLMELVFLSEDLRGRVACPLLLVELFFRLRDEPSAEVFFFQISSLAQFCFGLLPFHHSIKLISKTSKALFHPYSNLDSPGLN